MAQSVGACLVLAVVVTADALAASILFCLDLCIASSEFKAITPLDHARLALHSLRWPLIS